jgi:hypothetical protein
MKPRMAAKIVKMLLIALIGATLFGFAVRELWNAVMSPLFGLHTVTFWQALGLLLLAKIFFGGFHRHSGGRREWKWRMRQQWEQMTPEQRERLSEKVSCCRGPFASPVEPKS